MILYEMSTYVFKFLDQVAVRLKANWTNRAFQVGTALKRRRIISLCGSKNRHCFPMRFSAGLTT